MSKNKNSNGLFIFAVVIIIIIIFAIIILSLINTAEWIVFGGGWKWILFILGLILLMAFSGSPSND